MNNIIAHSSRSHEFIVAYEGPAHPSSTASATNHQALCVTLQSTGYDHKNGAPYVSKDDLLSSVSKRIGWPASVLSISRQYEENLFPNNINSSHDNIHQHPPLTITISPTYTSIRGGKGGFGTLLKGQSKQAGARTTLDFGACRDLSGRRLRHVNDEIKLRKWKELQEARAKAAERGEAIDEFAALQTPSGIRNWHLMVPSWSEGATQSNKGKRKIERQYKREARQFQSKEERANHAREQKRLDDEWAVMEYVRRGDEEGKRVTGGDVKDGILEHLWKRKKEQQKQLKSEGIDKSTEDTAGADTAAVASGGNDKSSFLEDNVTGDNSFSAHLMTLSGETSVFDATDESKKKSSSDKQVEQSSKLRIQSQSDFATVVVLLDTEKLKDISSSNNAKLNGIYVEYIIQTGGLAQIGWIRSPEGSSGGSATFLPNSDTGDGVGDDKASYGYDGSRGLKFHGGKEVAYGSTSAEGKESIAWKSGDVIGCWCKVISEQNVEIGYSVNGIDLGVAFTTSVAGEKFSYYPAVSLNLNEVMDINVGPDFAYDVKDRCFGACELVKTKADTNNAAIDENDDIPKGNSVHVDDNIPPRKKAKSDANKPEVAKQCSTQSEEKESFDLNSCSSIDDLKKMDPDRMKNILLSMGVKCGGTPDQRTERLFSLKGLRRDEYPMKVRGKNFIP